MITEELRPIREVERNLLLARLAAHSQGDKPRTARRLLSWCAILILCVVLPAGLFVLFPNPIFLGLSIAIMLLGGLICLYAILNILEDHFLNRGASREFFTSTRPLIETTLNTGTVLSTRVLATSVIEVAEDEDLGSGFIFDIGDNQSFLWKAQWDDPVDETMPWPCSEFELVRSTDKKLYIGLFCAGARLEPADFVELSKRDEHVAWEEMPEIVVKSPEAVLAELIKSK